MSTESISQQTKASIIDPPSIGQIVEHEDQLYKTVKEGLAYILVPPDAPILTDPKQQKEGGVQTQSVFYNPIQQYNRDLTVLAIRAFGDEYVTQRRAKLEKELERKQKKYARLQKQRSGTLAFPEQETGQPATKRRKLDNTGLTPTSLDQTGVSDASAENIEDGELNDEDFLACESSAGNGAAPASQNPEVRTSYGDVLAKTKSADRQVEVKFKILDALSATGLRALRYAQELPFDTSVTANDLSPKAVEMIKLNIEHNQLTGKIQTNVGNANAHMYSFVGQEGRGGPGPKYDVIDLDPYGTAVPFLDAAVQALADGGLLCVTCTDTGVFNSMGFLEKTFSLYGGLPVKGEHCHEAGLRLILHAITTSAAKYGLAIEPLLSLSIDYYARVFVRVRASPAEVKFLGSKTMLVYSCDHGCGAWQTQFISRAIPHKGKKDVTFYKHSAAQGPTASPLCEHCASKMHLSGPMYGGPLHNPAFIERMLSYLPSLDSTVYKTVERIEGMLETAYEELRVFDGPLLANNSSDDSNKAGFARLNETAVDRHPFYVIPSALARIIHCQAPSDAQMKGALRHAGYQAVRSHAKAGTIKTNAPWSAIWDIMREWVRQKAPIREGSLREGMAGFRIMNDQRAAERTQKLEIHLLKEEDKPTSVNQKRQSESRQQGDTAAQSSKEKSAQSEDDSRPRIIFDENLGREKQKKRLVRYQMNPRANWGPMTRAK